jgi:divinyl protochlorophyllide a 8-vinyl-reductase
MLIVERPTVLVGSHAPSDSGALAGPARIGPNAIIQVAHVLRDHLGEATAARLLGDVTDYTMDRLPGQMVDEREAQALVRHVLDRMGEARATPMLHEAGERTADYLLANRIPRPAQWIMRAAPRRVGLALLLKAMQAHAWTFAGSGTFTVRHTRAGTELAFHACTICRDLTASGPVCDFYAGTFERLVRQLVARTARVHEVECQAQGGRCCRFRIDGIH